MNTDKRTDEELNLIIAEWMGWRNPINIGATMYGWPAVPRTVGVLNTPVPDVLPKYCTDLNAIHEAEKKLNDHQSIRYLDQLWQNRNREVSNTTFSVFQLATARQRAEALVAVIQAS